MGNREKNLTHDFDLVTNDGILAFSSSGNRKLYTVVMTVTVNSSPGLYVLWRDLEWHDCAPV